VPIDSRNNNATTASTSSTSLSSASNDDDTRRSTGNVTSSLGISLPSSASFSGGLLDFLVDNPSASSASRQLGHHNGGNHIEEKHHANKSATDNKASLSSSHLHGATRVGNNDSQSTQPLASSTRLSMGTTTAASSTNVVAGRQSLGATLAVESPIKDDTKETSSVNNSNVGNVHQHMDSISLLTPSTLIVPVVFSSPQSPPRSPAAASAVATTTSSTSSKMAISSPYRASACGLNGCRGGCTGCSQHTQEIVLSNINSNNNKAINDISPPPRHIDNKGGGGADGMTSQVIGLSSNMSILSPLTSQARIPSVAYLHPKLVGRVGPNDAYSIGSDGKKRRRVLLDVPKNNGNISGNMSGGSGDSSSSEWEDAQQASNKRSPIMDAKRGHNIIDNQNNNPNTHDANTTRATALDSKITPVAVNRENTITTNNANHNLVSGGNDSGDVVELTPPMALLVAKQLTTSNGQPADDTRSSDLTTRINNTMNETGISKAMNSEGKGEVSDDDTNRASHYASLAANATNDHAQAVAHYTTAIDIAGSKVPILRTCIIGVMKRVWEEHNTTWSST
jgi:hypothetical protein